MIEKLKTESVLQNRNENVSKTTEKMNEEKPGWENSKNPTEYELLEVDTSGKFICSVDGCEKSYTKRYSLREHISCHYEAIKCKKCDLNLSSKRSLRRHLERTHGDKETTESAGDNMHKMDAQNQNKIIQASNPNSNVLNPESALTLQENTKSVEADVDNRFPCIQCGFRASTKVSLKKHIGIHTGEFFCTHCRTILGSKPALDRHSKTFHEIKPEPSVKKTSNPKDDARTSTPDIETKTKRHITKNNQKHIIPGEVSFQFPVFPECFQELIF